MEIVTEGATVIPEKKLSTQEDGKSREGEEGEDKIATSVIIYHRQTTIIDTNQQMSLNRDLRNTPAVRGGGGGEVEGGEEEETETMMMTVIDHHDQAQATAWATGLKRSW